MILMWGKDTMCAIGRVRPWKSRLFWAQKSLDFHGPTLPMAQVTLLPLRKFIRGKRHIKNTFIGNFMQMRTEWLFEAPNSLRPWCCVGGLGGYKVRWGCGQPDSQLTQQGSLAAKPGSQSTFTLSPAKTGELSNWEASRKCIIYIFIA